MVFPCANHQSFYTLLAVFGFGHMRVPKTPVKVLLFTQAYGQISEVSPVPEWQSIGDEVCDKLVS